MLGNDVIDLQQANLESNWQRKGYLCKICTLEEQQLILNSNDPFSSFWLLWSMKEAAYKVVNRLRGERNFNPVNFVCQQIERAATDVTAVVLYEEFQLFIRAELDAHFIHSKAVRAQADFAGLSSLKMQTGADYVERFNAISEAYLLKKNALGLPEIIERSTGKKYVATVSHHGRYLFIVYSGSLQLTS
jgi:phosphopantetheinyl transferase (holo-ACP synthase)